MEIFEETLKHEETVTGMINECVNVSITEKDHSSVNLLQWFVDEQVEEEVTINEIIDLLKMFNCQGNGLYMMDKGFKIRIFVGSTQV